VGGRVCRSASSSAIVGSQSTEISRVFVVAIRVQKRKAVCQPVSLYRVARRTTRDLSVCCENRSAEESGKVAANSW
jgi:hypothetical protein